MMMTIPLPFILDRTCLSWREAAWGYHNQHFSSSDALELAYAHLSNGEEDVTIVELAGLFKSQTREIGERLNKLASMEGDVEDASIKSKWLYLILSWLFENRGAFDDAFDAVEMIYSDFDYPEEMAPFVRYMPITDGYNPSVHSADENYDRLLAKWSAYIDTNNSSSRTN